MSKQEKKELSLEEIVHLTNEAGMAYVKAKREAERQDLLKASKRAKAMEKYDDGKLAEAKIRRLAETDQEYIDFLETLADLRLRSESCRKRTESYKNLLEAKRSKLSYQKAEMSLL